MFTNPVIQNLSLLAGRIMLSAIFILSGFNKLKGFSGGGTQKYMEAMGVPGALLPLVIITELGFGLMVLIGFKTRLCAFLLAGFTLLSALLFHNKLGDPAQYLQFMKNVSIAGGFLALLAAGAGAWSVDGRKGE
ncbi:MAG TPA: DoxX family protein [Rhabdaerophilum sp.]|nr:DoxX family protein [Rhabdaerophilum sp.]